MNIESGLRRLILIEVVFPMVLLIFGIYHGLMQVLFRAGVIRRASFLGIEYYQGLTLHGTINAIVFTTFFEVAFGYAVVRYHLGKGFHMGTAWISCALMLVGTLLAAIPMFTGHASVLYTFYPPLKAHPAFYVGLALFVVGSWVAFFNWIPPYRRWRKENPGKKVPLAVVGIFSTFIVWLIATLPVAYEVIVMLIPWSFGWVDTINVPLARLLFWFFGHPLVYFWILAVYVMYYTMLPRITGGKLFSDFAGRFTFLWFILYSAPIGIHHQFTEPAISSEWKFLHSFFTMLVAIPSFVTAFTLAASMEHGAKSSGGTGLFGWWGRLPYVSREGDRWLFSYLFSGLLVFIFGGITGIVNASYNMNNVVHNTSWLPAHFHQTLAGPAFLGFIGMSLMLVSKLLGKPIRFPGWNVWMPYIWITGIMIFSLGLFIGGIGGEPRRTNMGLTFTNPESPLYRVDWAYAKVLGTVGATVMTVAMAVYFVIFFATLFGKKRTESELSFPVSEPYHDEDVPVVQTFKPWIVASVILLVIAYVPPFLEVIRGRYAGAPAYSPGSPLVEKK